MRFRTPARLAALALLVALAGCDTSNPGGSITVRDLAGSYAFAELRFVPLASAIAPADVLTRLDAERSTVEIDTEGRTFFFLEESGARRIAEASLTASRSLATFRALAAQDVERLMRYLLPGTFSVSHDGGSRALSGTFNTTVDLHTYDRDRYNGLNAVQGTLFIRLERR